MLKELVICNYTIKENIRNRIFYLIVFFALIVIGSSFIFSKLSGELETRVILDVGLASIELFAFLAGVFAAVRLVLGEVENKSIYLVLSRPVSRYSYIVGRYLGTLLIMFVNILIMSAGLLLLLLAKGWVFNTIFIVMIMFIFLKIAIIISLGILISLALSSPVSSMVAVFFMWVIGHFSQEIKFLGEKVHGFAGVMLKGIYTILPNFAYYNLKDYLGADLPLAGVNASWAVIYAVVYTSIVIMLSVIVFSRKEF